MKEDTKGFSDIKLLLTKLFKKDGKTCKKLNKICGTVKRINEFKMIKTKNIEMSKFPLYDSLIKDLPKKDLTMTQKRAFIKRIAKIDKNGHDLVYALIRMYQVENNEENTSFTLPYNGTFIDNDINFDLDKFPVDLKQILFKFLVVHIGKMKEERSIEKQTPVKRV